MRGVHGGHPDPSILDFSASLNPLGPPAGVSKRLADVRSLAARYPSADADELCVAIAAHHGVPRESVLAGNGSVELIYLVAQTLAGQRVHVADPCFAEYAAACRVAGAHRADGGSADAIFVANPTSPRGTLLSRAVLLRAPGLRIVDEAFMGFTDERESLVHCAAGDRSLVVLRSLTKLYALAGLRAGYLVAHPETVRELRRRQPPWSVNAVAQAAGVAALADREYLEVTRARVPSLRASLERELRSLGLEPEPSDANYLLCRVDSARELCRALLERGIAVRDCTSFEGLWPDRFVRLAVRLEHHNARLVCALREVLE